MDKTGFTKFSNPCFSIPLLDQKILKHKIYNEILRDLANPQIFSVSTGERINFILHENAKEELRDIDRFSRDDFENLENSILEAALNSKQYEVKIDAPRLLFYELNKANKINWIFDNRIVPLPNYKSNAGLCEKLKKIFSREELLSVDGFIEVSSYDDEGDVVSYIRLDIDEKIVRNGFMVPVMPKGRNGLIEALRVYRYPNDERPFVLRSRIKRGDMYGD